MDCTVLSIVHDYHSLLQIKQDLDFWSTNEYKYYAEISFLFTIDNPSYTEQKFFQLISQFILFHMSKELLFLVRRYYS